MNFLLNSENTINELPQNTLSNILLQVSYVMIIYRYTYNFKIDFRM